MAYTLQMWNRPQDPLRSTEYVCVWHSCPRSAGNLQASTFTGSLYHNAKQKQIPKHISKKLKMHHTCIKNGSETVCMKKQVLGYKIRTFI